MTMTMHSSVEHWIHVDEGNEKRNAKMMTLPSIGRAAVVALHCDGVPCLAISAFGLSASIEWESKSQSSLDMVLTSHCTDCTKCKRHDDLSGYRLARDLYTSEFRFIILDTLPVFHKLCIVLIV